MNIPIGLTLLRIGLIPIFVAVFYLPYGWASTFCAAVFAFAAITDWFDGYLARKWHQTSAFGAFLDPVADKLLVGAALVLLVQADPRPVIAIPATVIIGREIAVSALREWMAQIGAQNKISVALLGKLKTVSQLVAITLMLYSIEERHYPVYLIGHGLLYLATLLTLWSMTAYLMIALPNLRNEKKPSS